MKINKLLPTILFFSIILLLPMTWYKNAIVNPNTYAIEDLSGFDAFNVKYPLIHCYTLSFILLISSFKYKKLRTISAFMIGVFCFIALIFPVFLGYIAFSGFPLIVMKLRDETFIFSGLFVNLLHRKGNNKGMKSK